MMDKKFNKKEFKRNKCFRVIYINIARVYLFGVNIRVQSLYTYTKRSIRNVKESTRRELERKTNLIVLSHTPVRCYI